MLNSLEVCVHKLINWKQQIQRCKFSKHNVLQLLDYQLVEIQRYFQLKAKALCFGQPTGHLPLP